MKKDLLVALVVWSSLATAHQARAATPAQQVASQPQQLVFVGRLLSIEEAPDPCKTSGTCISMDALYTARYEVVEPIVGQPAQREIAVHIADHYGFPGMARWRHALLFVQLLDEGPWLHKYQGFALHPLADGGWGFCGGAREAREMPGAPVPRPLPFDADLGLVDDVGGSVRRAAEHGEHFAPDGDRIYCRAGLRLPELYEAVRTGVMQARGVVLPAWGAHGGRAARESGE
jgi:hypothetical protein